MPSSKDYTQFSLFWQEAKTMAFRWTINSITTPLCFSSGDLAASLVRITIFSILVCLILLFDLHFKLYAIILKAYGRKKGINIDCLFK